VLGTDFPYQADDLFRSAVSYLRRVGLSVEDLTAILDHNLLKLG